MANPKRSNRPGTRDGRPAGMNGNDTSGAKTGANGTNGASEPLSANGTNGTSGGLANTRASSPSARASNAGNGAAPRPIVSSIRERSGTNRPQARKRYEVKKSWWQERLPMLVTVTTVVLLVAIFFVIAHGQNNGPDAGNLDQSVFHTITNVSPTTFDKVGTGGLKSPLQHISPSGTSGPSGPVLTKDGHPEILYVGAEYCPYCAAERWSVAIALSRFGTWQGLNTTSSAGNDVFPNTNTLTFHGATYSSKYITFVSKEIQDRDGKNLETLSSDEQSVFTKYDAPPYTTQQDAGGIPFISFGNQYMTLSAGYSPAVLHQGQDGNAAPLNDKQIAQALSDPKNPVAQNVLGNANYITATICKLTNNQPSSVCNSQTIQQIEANLPK